MPTFPDWLSRVLADGESVQEGPPSLAAAERPATRALLRAAFDRHALDVAGPPIPFAPDAAEAAAVALAAACWRLASGDDAGPLPAVPGHTPAEELSADVCLRLLPAVYRRALLRDASGELAAELERLFRARPFSGVLADLDGGPAAPLDFGGHAGLQLLYAERLVATARPGWVPPAGAAREWAGRVFAERGRRLK